MQNYEIEEFNKMLSLHDMTLSQLYYNKTLNLVSMLIDMEMNHWMSVDESNDKSALILFVFQNVEKFENNLEDIPVNNETWLRDKINIVDTGAELEIYISLKIDKAHATELYGEEKLANYAMEGGYFAERFLTIGAKSFSYHIIYEYTDDVYDNQ